MHSQMPATLLPQFKVCLLNAENLFLLFEQKPPADVLQLSEGHWQRLSTSIYENKPLRKTLAIAQALKEIDADLIMFCEVGGRESLENFNDLFLEQKYSVALIEGNSDRNIDVGYLIKKDMPFYFDLMSNKNRLINYLYPHERDSKRTGYPTKVQTSHKLSRDCAELRLFTKSADDPFMIFLLTHLKSRLDPDRIDPGGFERRQAEFRTVLEIYGELSEKFPQIPIALCGDLNGNASRNQTAEEFQTLYKTTDLEDVLELAQVPQTDRGTFYQVRTGGRSEGRQIDFCLLNQASKSLLAPGTAKVYRWRDNLGLELAPPRTLEQKLLLPSDHYPVIFTLQNISLSTQK